MCNVTKIREEYIKHLMGTLDYSAISVLIKLGRDRNSYSLLVEI